MRNLRPPSFEALLTGVAAREVEVVRVVNVTEECGQQAEYCQLDLRTQAISQETILCQQPGDVVSTQHSSYPATSH